MRIFIALFSPAAKHDGPPWLFEWGLVLSEDDVTKPNMYRITFDAAANAWILDHQVNVKVSDVNNSTSLLYGCVEIRCIPANESGFMRHEVEELVESFTAKQLCPHSQDRASADWVMDILDVLLSAGIIELPRSVEGGGENIYNRVLAQGLYFEQLDSKNLLEVIHGIKIIRM